MTEPVQSVELMTEVMHVTDQCILWLFAKMFIQF